jgi:mono/diheme cytochrome c family protein
MSVSVSHVALSPVVAPTEEITFTQTGWFGGLAVACLAVVSLIGLLLALWLQAAEAVRDGWRFVDGGWLMIATVGSVSGLAAAALAWRANVARQGMVAAVCLTLAMMASLATLAAVAIEAVALGRYPQSIRQPEAMRIGATSAPSPVQLAPTIPAAVEADAVSGGRRFAASCAACHGGTGEGVGGIGPALAATSWLTQRDDQQVLNFLTVGRMPGDPDSVMGRAMPARGGNMSLTDADLADIVAYLRTLAPVDGAEASGPVAATAPRWLRSPPEVPQTSLLAAGQMHPLAPHHIGGVTRSPFDPGDRDLAVLCLATINGVRGLLVIALMLVMAWLLARHGADMPGSAGTTIKCIGAGWLALVVMNLVVLVAQTAMT